MFVLEVLVEAGLPIEFGVVAQPQNGFVISSREKSLTQIVAPVGLLDGAGNPTPSFFFGEVLQNMSIVQSSINIRSEPMIYPVWRTMPSHCCLSLTPKLRLHYMCCKQKSDGAARCRSARWHLSKM